MAQKEGISVAYSDAIEQGVALCRTGNWDEGLMCLNHVLQTSKPDAEFPANFYSYLGYGVARKENRIAEGLKLCQKAVSLEFYEPSHYLNLARVNLLAGKRRKVAAVIKDGLRLDPNHHGLLKLQEIFGVRSNPVIPFLSRDSFLNRHLGVLRHRYRQSRSQKMNMVKVQTKAS